MSSGKPRFEDYDREEAEEFSGFILSGAAQAKEFINKTSDPDAIRYLVEERNIDVDVPGSGAEIEQAILTSQTAPLSVKQTVAQRNDDLGDIRVPDTVQKNAETALDVGKPIVLYGPTGTGKTYFAKQLALKTCINYSISTATPSWTPADITGSIQPETDDGEIKYVRQAGCVSQGIQKANEYHDNWGVIIDEITRADISQVFGPLYTAIEDYDQAIFRDEEGNSLTLNDDVKIICTMNMSDRTVNELDNAITRRFAMIEVDEYEEDKRRQLFKQWLTTHVSGVTDLDESELLRLFERDYHGINHGHEATSQGAIMRFGPMHYRDIAVFLGVGCREGGAYEHDQTDAVGQAFQTYIVPRLLNAAAFPQVERIAEHYRALNGEFEAFDLTPAAELAERELEQERRQMGSYE